MGSSNWDTAEATVPLTNQPNSRQRHINISPHGRPLQHRQNTSTCSDVQIDTGLPSRSDVGVAVRPGPSATGTTREKVSNMLQDGTILFVLDLRGDPLISRYGGIDKSKVPPYRRAGRGRLMGSRGHLVLHHDGSKESFSISLDRIRDSARRGNDHPLANVASVKTKPVKVRPASASELVFDPSQDFISLNPARKRKWNEHVSSEDEGPNYRSIEGKAKEHEFSDSDLDYSSDSSSTSQSCLSNNPIIQRNIELKRHLVDHPDDSEAWLERISLQDDVLRVAKNGVRELTEAEKKSQADIKLDMIHKAFKHVKPENQTHLQVSLMSEGMKVWDKAKLAKKWKEFEKEDKNLSLFKLHLKALLMCSEGFVYEDIKEIFVGRIHALKGRVARVHEDIIAHDIAGEKVIPYYEQLLYIFLRATRFILDSGYAELAVAAWQAFLEMHFCRPPELTHLSTQAARNWFKEFWESEVARIGEAGAKGWNRFEGSCSQQDHPEAEMQEEPSFAPTTDPYEAWALRERYHTENSKMPIRLMSLREGQDYDPFKLVLFEDIQPLLFDIPSSLLPEMKNQLIDAFLIFCRLPPAFAGSENIQSALRDPFLMSGLYGLERAILNETSSSLEPQQVSWRRPTFVQYGSNHVSSLSVLFPGRNWFQYLPSWPKIHGSSEWTVNQVWALDVVRQLVCFHWVEELAEYYLALESAKDSGRVKNVAKMLLRKFPANIGLYNAYALAELANENPEIARKVVESASNLEVDDKLMLYYTWAWVELEGGNKTAAILRLCQGVYPTEGVFQPDIPSPTFILKAKQTLSSARDYLLSSGSHSAAAESALALTLVDYLTVPPATGDSSPTQGNISAALDAIETFNSAFLERYSIPTVQESQSHQRFLQDCSRLLYYHATHGPHRPADLREAMVSFSKMYPANTLLLSMVAWADSAVAASNPLRASGVKNILETHSFRPQHDCPAVRTFAIRHASTISPYAARAAFESALKSDACTSGASPLWLAYVRFVASHSAFRPRRPRKKSRKGEEVGPQRNEMARKTYYRAVNACPGVKGVVMEAFNSLKGQMGRDELADTGREMVSWGMRISVDLEDFVTEFEGLAS